MASSFLALKQIRSLAMAWRCKATAAGAALGFDPIVGTQYFEHSIKQASPETTLEMRPVTLLTIPSLKVQFGEKPRFVPKLSGLVAVSSASSSLA